MSSITMTSPQTYTSARIVLNEVYNPEVMKGLLIDTTKHEQRILRRLAEYKRERGNGASVQVVYNYGRGCEENQLGRLFANKSMSLQSFPRDIRNPLAADFYWDVDMENCHYILLQKLAEDWGLAHANIDKYIKNRNAELLKVSSNRHVAKTAFLKVAYGGSIKAHDVYADDITMPDGDTTLVELITKEMTAIVEYCWLKNISLHKVVKAKANKKFSLFAFILQTEERKCILTAVEWLKSKDRSMEVLIHDGGYVRKLPGEREFPRELLAGLDEAVLKATGYPHHFTEKPLTHSFVASVLPLVPAHILVNDSFAASEFVRLMGDGICMDAGSIYVFSAQTGIWSSNVTELNQAIQYHKDSLVFQQMDAQGRVSKEDYGGNLKKRENFKAMLPTELVAAGRQCNGFMDVGRERATRKLLFKNGIYDFETDTLGGFSKDIVFSYAMPFPYSEDEVREDIKFVEKYVFEDAFDKKEVSSVYSHYLMRGVVGDYRCKKMVAVMGETNSGKTLLMNFFQYAMGDNIGIIDANSMLLKKTQDSGRDNAFIADMVNRRIVFTSEIKVQSTLDGNLLKKIVSGGDTIKVRKLYKEEENVLNRSMMVMFANEFPSISPPDNAVYERMIPVQCEHSYVHNPKPNTNQRQIDVTLQQQLNQPKYALALFHHMIHEFKRFTRGEFKEPILPAIMVEHKEELCPIEDIRPILEQFYDLTGNTEDIVPFTDIFNNLQGAGCIYSENKVSRLLTLLKLGKDAKKIDRKTVKIRTGIREI